MKDKNEPFNISLMVLNIKELILLSFSFLAVMIVAVPQYYYATGTHVFMGPLRQQIGKYRAQLDTEPKNPITGKDTIIIVKITNLEDKYLGNIPVVLTISKDNIVISRTNATISNGQIRYSILFPSEGVYGLDIIFPSPQLVNGTEKIQQTVFEFPIKVSSQISSILSPLSMIMAVSIIVIVIALLLLRKYHRKLRT